MNKHPMKLKKEPFMCIASWTKTIKLRLYDKKRQQIKLWDTIEFTNQDNEWDPILTKTVIWLLHYRTFEDIINDFDPVIFWDREADELLELLYTFYRKEDEKKYWIIGIRI